MRKLINYEESQLPYRLQSFGKVRIKSAFLAIDYINAIAINLSLYFLVLKN